MLWPSRLRVDRAAARRLLEELASQPPTRGLPAGLLGGQAIAISIATQVDVGLDATSSPADRVIIVPLDGALHWTRNRLRRVIRHEMAHLRLRAFLDYRHVPAWFQEGFAEWAGGGLTCEGDVRIRLDVMSRSINRNRPPSFLQPAFGEQTRLAYDYYTTVFEFVDAKYDGIVANQRLLQAVREAGLGDGFRRVTGTSLEQLAADWQTHVMERYDGLPERTDCGAVNRA